MKKKKGEFMVHSTGFFVITVSFILLMYGFSLYSINAQHDIVSNGITASNLAVFKDLDLEKLGEDTNTLIIGNPKSALETYKKHLKYNLQLDNNFKPINNVSFIKSNVNISKFIIYNVVNNDVYIYTMNSSTGIYSTEVKINGKGVVKTPRDNLVTDTTVHSEIKFDINPMFNKNHTVNISEDSDITKSN